MPAAQHLFLRCRRGPGAPTPVPPSSTNRLCLSAGGGTLQSGLEWSDRRMYEEGRKKKMKKATVLVSPGTVWVFVWVLKGGGPPPAVTLTHLPTLPATIKSGRACRATQPPLWACAISISSAYSPWWEASALACVYWIYFSLQRWWIFHLPVLYGGAPLREAAHQDCCIFCHSPSHTVCSMPFQDFALPGRPCFSILWGPI